MRQPMSSRLRRVVAAGFAAAVALSLSACAESERDDTPGNDEQQTGGTFTFGAAGAPEHFDPFYASDGETFRVTRQIYDGLLHMKQGTADVEPALATEWESSEDGLTWTFTLREGVKFHDGTDFNADVVCANFERMYDQNEAGQSPNVTTYWIDNMGPGFADGEDPSVYKSCTAENDTTVIIEINRFTSKFPQILALPSFSMQSPAAMEEFDANGIQAAGEGFSYPAYALEHPTGSGPFKFGEFDKANNTIELARNEDYWGDPPKLDKLIFKIIPDETARKQELQAGTIDGYDFPNPADWAQLEADGFNIQIRPAFNVLYVGMSQLENEALEDIRVRQAIGHALNREQLVSSLLPDGAEVATQFIPSTLDGYNADLEALPYDPERAKLLLDEAGHSDLEIEFYWPAEVTRPYMPNPRDIFGALEADLKAVGITVKPVSKPWNGGYLDDALGGQAELYLLGWTGDYNTPDNFLANFFADPEGQFYAADTFGPELAEDITAADSIPDDAERQAAYQELNKKIMTEYLPGIPVSHSPPAIVVKEGVEGLIPSPLTDERFFSVSVPS